MTVDDLKVLVLSRSYPSDVLPSFGLWVERPTTMLAERCSVRVLAPVPYCPPLPELGALAQYARFRKIPRREVRKGVEVLRPRFLAGPGHTLYGYEADAFVSASVRDLDRLRDEFPFDLVHAHFVYPEGAAASRLARRYGVPFVITEHAPWTSAWFRKPRVRGQALAAAAEAAQILAVSSSVRDTIVSYTGQPDRVRVVPIGVDVERFAPNGSTRNADQILFVGWPNYNKGVDLLLQAMKVLVESGEPGRLLVVGESQYRNTRLQEEQLKAYARSLDLGDRVAFVGRKPHHEVAALMAQSAVVVLPSRAESFGAVLVEALACGTPVVATRCGGPEDIVIDEVGALVAPEDPAALAAAIRDVLHRPDRYDRGRLREYAVRRFGWSHVVDQVHDAYLDAAA